jgi:predicted nucleic acid-binding protein
MISADSSAIVAFLQGQKGKDVEMIEEYFLNCKLVLSPVVVSELLSDPKLPTKTRDEILILPTLAITHGYWARAGLMRAKLIEKKLKARLSDVLIAQSCLDHDTALITRDQDFRHFVKYFGLKTL